MMEKINTFIQNLDNQHESFTKENVNINSLLDNLAFYESFIPEFFSKNGESEGIKKVYKSIKENMGSEKSIISSDITKSGYIYKEYMEGMTSFINDIFNTAITESTDELKSYKEKFEKAKEKDSLFINSLFNGSLNEQVEMPLSEAVCNLEYLIDFIPELSDMKEKCSNLNESYNNIDNNEKEALINNSLNMLFESVDNYCYSTIKNIVTTYSEIQDKLFNETVQNNNVNNFKLF